MDKQTRIKLKIEPLPLDKHAELRYNKCVACSENWENMALESLRDGKKKLADVAFRAAYAYRKSAIFWSDKL